MTWFRKARDAIAEPPAADVSDDPATLRYQVFQLNRYVNQHAGQLPGESVVMARRVTDVLREILDGADARPLDIHTLVSVKSMINDYLPTTLGQFVALDEGQTNVVRPSGRTPIQSLLEQLEALLEGAAAVLIASKGSDADALLAQGSFLRTKFSRSDLDL